MQLPGTIAARTTRGVMSTIAQRGADPVSITARMGVPHAFMATQGAVMPLATFTTILEVAAAEMNNTSLGLELGRAFRLEDLGLVAALVMSSRTLGDALEKYLKYFPCLQSNTKTALSVSNGMARLAYSIDDPTVRFRVQDAIFTLALEYSMIRKALGHSFRCCHIDFEHRPDDDIDDYRAHFSSPVRYGRDMNAINFPAHYLDAPIFQADSASHVRIEAELADDLRKDREKLDLVSGLEAWITACLARSVTIDIEHAASDFGMSLRSFQRKLGEHGISYLDVRNRVRGKIAMCMLAETDLPVTFIALYLGYSETSSFSRAFKQLSTLSPAEYRNAARH